MNENERKYFLKRFFTFNTTSSFNSSSNGSFNEGSETDDNMNPRKNSTDKKEDNLSNLIQDISILSYNNNNNANSASSPPPSILVNKTNEESNETDHFLTNTSLKEIKNKYYNSTKSINESTASTPSSITPLIPGTVVQKVLNESNYNNSSSRHQNGSIELKNLKSKKEVQIVEFDSSLNNSNSSSKTEQTCIYNNSLNYQHEVFNESLKKISPKPQVLRYRNLGKSGLRVSQFGLGTWVTFGSQISDETAEEILTTAYQNGINLFDTAEVYAAGKAELALGRILKKKNWKRSSYIVCTKIYVGGKAETEKGLSRKHVIEGVNASLERLQLNYVDIVFANKPDAGTPMEEIVRAFTHLINTDKTFYWGTSRWNSMEIMEAYSVARQFNLIPPICEQAEYHLFQREEVELNLPDVYTRIGIGTMTWSPLACGILTGKYDDGIPVHSRASLKGYGWLKDKILSDDFKRKQAKLRELQLIADKLNCSITQLAIAWCLKNEGVHCVLLGASSVDQLIENIQSLQVVPKLTLPVMIEIDKILGNKPISRHASKSENLQKT